MLRPRVRFGLAALLSLVVLLVLPWSGNAQDLRTVSGTVTIQGSDQPLPGVQVFVQGTRIGTLTDSQGNFSLTMPASAEVMVFSYLGYKTAELPVASNMQVGMEIEALGLEGITVTALGLRREKQTLGYSVQDLQGSEISEVPELNLVNSLQGNIAGVNVTNAGPTGGSSRIVIRGASSIAGNNQPLFVIDGFPIDNSAPRNAGYGGIDYGNSVSDIDPANIENISVLKGPAAAALYGSRAANGAVVITTKTGQGSPSGGLGMTVTASYTAETPLKLPDYQNEYGQGLFGEFQWVDGAGAGLWDFVDESWGPKLDGRLIDQFTGPQQPWVAHPNNVRDFFETGRTLNTNVAVSHASDRSNVRLSVSNMNLDGMSPANKMNRLTLGLKGGTDITDRLRANASVTYIDSNVENRPGTGYDEDNPMQQYIWFGRQVDMEPLRNYRCTGDEVTPCTVGGQYNWNYNYHNNPFWEAYVNENFDEKDRILGNADVTYQVNDWITATGRVGRDWSRDHRKRVTEWYSLDDAGDGGFGENTIYRSLTNADALLSATRQLTDDIAMDVTGGAHIATSKFETANVGVTKLTVPGVFTIDNDAGTVNPTDYLSEWETRSVSGSLSLNYKGFWNVDVTGRNDWSSTLPDGENSYFYPSVSSAFVFTDALNMSTDVFSSGKIRASWTRVGNDAGPYQLASVFNSLQAWGSTPMFAVPNELPNTTLKPEETTAWEIGTDLGFFNERLGFVATYYDRSTKNQILGVQVSTSSGYSNQRLNAGEVRNWGWEVLLKAMPVRLDNGFRWNVTANWSKNNSEVTELYGDLETLVLGSYWSMNIEARLGEPYGLFFGNGYLQDDDGNWLLDSSGRPQRDTNRRILGNYNPDWLGGLQNRFSYGAFDLSVLVDGQKGGDIFSVTNWFGEYAGVLESSLRGREEDFCTPGIVVEGILPDGSVNGDGVDDVTVCPQSYFGRNYGNQEASIDDATYIKLREVRLGYELPGAWMARLGFSSGNVALIGRNLFLWAPNIDNIDPETAFDASNVQGIEFGQFPSARSIGLSFTITP
ncbi:MAG: SusC/RagA family TonB-linked outer membrane protein [Gemmatimonadetes bacterium]|nr:SusC/RagA family TonB-linked outer membrane protein [Gemmatimonadota bacterium]